MRWLAKLRRYDGSTTVLGYFDTREAAAERAAEWNDRYQTDSAHVEEWDDAQATWPTAARRAYENGLHR